jgi:SAM-dependent methyltransferase
MIIKPGTDRDNLMHNAYASDEALAVRQRTHDLYSSPKINFPEWVLNRIAWRGDEQVLDVGTGSGLYFEAIQSRIPNGRLIGADLSFGMVQRAAQQPLAAQVGLINSDVQALPFANHSFDVVLANHMLFHVPDINQALTELRRVLKPEGILIAATNARYNGNNDFNMGEFDNLIGRGCQGLGMRRSEIETLMERIHQSTGEFTIENGPSLLSHHFFAVQRSDLPGTLIFPEAQPAVDYVNSMRALREPFLPDTIPWSALILAIKSWLESRMTFSSYLAVPKLSGVLVATNGGGFALDYINRLHASEANTNGH